MSTFVEEYNKQRDENFQINIDHGFESFDFNFGEKIALIHGELSEAIEWARKGDDVPSNHIPEFTGVEEELADAIIRIMNLGARMKLRIAEAMLAKQAFNAARPFKHGDKRF